MSTVNSVVARSVPGLESGIILTDVREHLLPPCVHFRQSIPTLNFPFGEFPFAVCAHFPNFEEIITKINL